jgi:hypothetical protein
MQNVETVEDNAAFCTQQQFERAKMARDLKHALGCRSNADLKRSVKINYRTDCPVTVDGIELSEAIFCPDVASLKGKTTRGRPIQVVSALIEIPPELVSQQQIVDLCIDTMFGNGLPFFTSIRKRLIFRTCTRLLDRSSKICRSALEEIFRVYEDGGFRMYRIHGDQDFKQE